MVRMTQLKARTPNENKSENTSNGKFSTPLSPPLEGINEYSKNDKINRPPAPRKKKQLK